MNSFHQVRCDDVLKEHIDTALDKIFLAYLSLPEKKEDNPPQVKSKERPKK